MKIYHFLHESAIGAVNGERISSSQVLCVLPDGFRYRIYVDERDKRTLIVFDGELLYGGLPKNAKVIQSLPLDSLLRRNNYVRNNPDYPCSMPAYDLGLEDVSIKIYRHFVLLPSCLAAVRKFRDANLSPIYVFITVVRGKKGPIVEWRTTSY